MSNALYFDKACTSPCASRHHSTLVRFAPQISMILGDFFHIFEVATDFGDLIYEKSVYCHHFSDTGSISEANPCRNEDFEELGIFKRRSLRSSNILVFLI